jgi:glycogen debranching enzyme
MDAKVGDWVVTPRIGKPVEIQALWINALEIGGRFSKSWGKLATRAKESFANRFWNDRENSLFDVIDVDHQPGAVDARFRPNQILAVGGLPISLLDGRQAHAIVQAVEQRLWTPLGLRTLTPEASDYSSRYEGGVRQRDGSYHQGTVWPWLIGPFVEAWLRVNGSSLKSKEIARERFLRPLLEHLDVAGLGHVSEIADADAPHTPRGCPFQAWSLGELLRIQTVLEPEDPSRALFSGSSSPLFETIKNS